MEVFVDEQRVPVEAEIDEHDAVAVHVLAFDGDEPIGTARVHVSNGVAHIGRVAVKKRSRGTGVGAEIVRAALERARELGVREVELDAQTYAIGFYERFGFVKEGD